MYPYISAVKWELLCENGSERDSAGIRRASQCNDFPFKKIQIKAVENAVTLDAP